LEQEHLYQRIAAHLIESARVKHAAAGQAADDAMSAGTAAAAAFSPVAPARGRGIIPEIASAAELIASTFRDGGKLLLCGNGGSAADCQHMATEFTSRLSRDFERAALPAIALTTDTSFLTAYANDVGFRGVFSRQVEALGKPGDVLVAISTSGNSPNILAAVEAARVAGIRTIGLSGSSGRLQEMVDVAIAVPSTHTSHIQEAHLAFEHIICDLVEQMLFAKDAPPPPLAPSPVVEKISHYGASDQAV
jgi:D-sedoheptulose 7-phosphate isomerase